MSTKMNKVRVNTPDTPETPTDDSNDKQNSRDWNLHRMSFSILAICMEIAIVLLYVFFVEYSDVAAGGVNSSRSEENIQTYYPFFQDVNVMIFIGIGFLMTFLRKYSFSSVGYNLLIAAFTIQIAVLWLGLWERIYEHSVEPDGHAFDHRLEISIVTMIKSLFAAGTILISLGACLGKTTPTQLIVMALLEVCFFALNEIINVNYLKIVDMGGSIVVHTFGAYFGLAVSRTISSTKSTVTEKSTSDKTPHTVSTRTSDTFAMIGTLFLWVFWPSFNGALATADQQQRVAINTFFALAAGTCAAFLVDGIVRPNHKFDMVSIQNATLAGGVAVGSSSDLVIQPWGAIIIGLLGGAIAVIGYVYIAPILEKKLHIHDTCGIHNLHGLPGILGAICGAISASLADLTVGQYVSEEQIIGIFPARAPCQTNHSVENFNAYPCGVTASTQGGLQASALLVTLGVSIITGIFTGLILKLPCFLNPNDQKKKNCGICGESSGRQTWFKDSIYWEVEQEDLDKEQDQEEPGETKV